MKAMKRNIFIGLMLTFLLAFTGCGKDKTYDVEFIVENVTITTSNIKEGEKVSKPEDPSKTGYNFVGWYNGDTKFDFNSEIKGEIDLVARFEAINYTITLDLDGGEIEGETSITYNIEQEITLKEPTKAGLVFAGWKEEGSNNIIRTVEIAKGTTGNKKYKAIYGDSEQTILYKDNILYKIMDVVTNGRVLDSVDNLDETTVGWFKDPNLYLSVTEDELIVPGMTLYTKSLVKGEADFSYNEGLLYVWASSGWNGVVPRRFDGKLVTSVYINDLYYEEGTVITLPSSVTKLGESNGIRNFANIPSTVKIISNTLVKVTGPLSIEIAKSNPLIQEEAFMDMPLTNITFEEGSLIESIGKRAFSKTKITSITIPNSVKTIDERAFLYARSLTNVVFAQDSQLETIGEASFRGTGLVTITIPNSVKTIGRNAFAGNNDMISSLTTVIFEENSQLETIGEDAFGRTKLTTITIPSSVKTIGNYAFSSIETLTSVEFGEDSQLETIGDSAFWGTTKLTTITIPSSVKTIGNYAFFNNNEDTLTSVKFEEGSQLETIGDYAFKGTKLTTIVIPSSVKAIGKSAFEHSSLESLTFAENSQLETIGDYAFSLIRASSIVIPKSVKTIGAHAFESYYNTLINVKFEEYSQLETIGEGAFDGASITSTTIPTGVTNIGGVKVEVRPSDNAIIVLKENTEIAPYAFIDLPITKIIFEENSQLETIGKSAFSGTKMTSIVIPSRVKTIEKSAFSSIDTLHVVGFGENSQLETIGDSAFAWTNLTTITIPAGVTNIGGVMVEVRPSDNAIIVLKENTEIMEYAFAYLPIEKIIFEEDSQIHTIQRCAFYKSRITEIELPSSVKIIRTSAFYDASLETITFQANSQLETIENSAFYSTYLYSVVIPSNVKTIGAYAFEFSALESVTFEANSKLETIGVKAFRSTKLTTVTIPSSVKTISDQAFNYITTLTSVIFGENSQLETIGEEAFSITKLTTVTIPSSVKTIGEDAFNVIGELTQIIVDSQDVYEEISAEFLGNHDCDIHVLKTLSGTNSYLQANYDRTESGDYYVYTKKAN